jgi:hypothetical protein
MLDQLTLLLGLQGFLVRQCDVEENNMGPVIRQTWIQSIALTLSFCSDLGQVTLPKSHFLQPASQCHD